MATATTAAGQEFGNWQTLDSVTGGDAGKAALALLLQKTGASDWLNSLGKDKPSLETQGAVAPTIPAGGYGANANYSLSAPTTMGVNPQAARDVVMPQGIAPNIAPVETQMENFAPSASSFAPTSTSPSLRDMAKKILMGGF